MTKFDEELYDGPAIHPGEILKSWLMDENGIDENSLAEKTEIPKEYIDDIIAGRGRVDREVATRLSKIFGEMAETLFRMQYEYDFFQENRKLPGYEELPSLEP